MWFLNWVYELIWWFSTVCYFHYSCGCTYTFIVTIPDCILSCGRYAEILGDFKKDPESHGGPPDCIVSHIWWNYWLVLVLSVIDCFVYLIISFFCFLTIWDGVVFQLLCRIRDQILRELGFRDIFKKVKASVNFECNTFTMDSKRKPSFLEKRIIIIITM